MCFYCGCREIPLLRDYIAEHERVTDLGADLSKALRRGDLPDDGRLMTAVAGELDTHWRGEEEGLFAAMHDDPAYREYIDNLIIEHRELRDLLATADLAAEADQLRILAAMDDLYEHILREEDGLFPAALTALSGDQWEQAMAAWRAHHRGDPIS
jgi:hypothetical protein